MCVGARVRACARARMRERETVHSVSQMSKRYTDLQLMKTSSRPVRTIHILSFALLLEMSVGYFSMIMKQNTRLSGMYRAILNISRTSRMAVM